MIKIAKPLSDFWWAIPTAFVVPLTAAIRWWHPYCDSQADGPGYFASGFPLPFSMPTGASSMSYWIAPLPLAADVLIFLAVILATVHLLGRLRFPLGSSTRLAIKMLLAVTGLTITIVSLSIDTTFSQDAFRYPANDSLGEYRPWFWAKNDHHRACDS